MSQNFNKWLTRTETYIDHQALKHTHKFTIRYLLVVTNINKHASSNYYGKRELYYILKCSECNSFIPDSIEGNYNHQVLSSENIDNSLPVMTANTMQKCPHYNFSKLTDVKIKKE